MTESKEAFFYLSSKEKAACIKNRSGSGHCTICENSFSEIFTIELELRHRQWTCAACIKTAPVTREAAISRAIEQTIDRLVDTRVSFERAKGNVADLPAAIAKYSPSEKLAAKWLAQCESEMHEFEEEGKAHSSRLVELKKLLVSC